MACLEKAYNSNFLKWNKVTGSLTLAQLQSGGLPSDCDNISLPAPTTLTATANNPNEINLLWSVVTDSDSYNLYRSESEATGYTLLINKSSKDYDNVSLPSSKQYYYKLSYIISGTESLLSDSVNATTPNPLAWYKFDNNANDSSGNAYNGTLVGGTYGPDKDGNALSAVVLDGFNDYVNIDAALTPLASTTVGTWIAWVKPTDATPVGREVLLSFSETDGGATRMQMQIETDGDLRVLVRDTSVLQWDLYSDASPFTSGVWTHIAAVFNGTDCVFYADGSLLASTYTTTTDKTSYFNDLPAIDNGRIGDLETVTGVPVQFFDGSMDKVKIYNKAYTAAEILAEYNNDL